MNPVNEKINKLKFLRFKHLTELFEVNRKTIYRWIDAGQFPKPIRITQRTVLFDAEKVLRCLEERQG